MKIIPNKTLNNTRFWTINRWNQYRIINHDGDTCEIVNEEINYKLKGTVWLVSRVLENFKDGSWIKL